MFHTFSFLSCHFSSSSFFFFFLTFLFASCFFCFFCSRERERERKKSCQSQRISFSEKRKKIGKIVPQTHNILFKPTETLAKNTKKIQKNVPARARYIIRILSAPRNTVGTTQRVRCHPGGTPRSMLEYSKRLSTTGGRDIFLRAR